MRGVIKMPIRPDDLNNLTAQDTDVLKTAYIIIDEILRKRFDGSPVFISTGALPPLNQRQRIDVVSAYKKVGWGNVYFERDRDGSYLYISK